MPLLSDLQHNKLIQSEQERMLKVQYVQASHLTVIITYSNSFPYHMYIDLIRPSCDYHVTLM